MKTKVTVGNALSVVGRARGLWTAAMILAASINSGLGGVQETGRAFPPSIPAPTSGDVRYHYLFFANASGDIECGTTQEAGGTTATIYSRTEHDATVGGTPTLGFGVADKKWEQVPNCVTLSCSGMHHCSQQKDWSNNTIPTYSPLSDDPGTPICDFCGYFAGQFYNSVSGGAFFPTTTVHTEGRNPQGVLIWTMDVTEPTDLFPGFFYESQVCPCETGSLAPAFVMGWSAFYELNVWVKQGATPPTPPPVAGTGKTGTGEPIQAHDDSASTIMNFPVTIAVLANDTHILGHPLTVSAVSQGNHGGSVVINSGQTMVTYTPANGFLGVETFTYTASDGLAADGATVTVTVGPAGPVVFSFTPASATPGATVVISGANFSPTASGNIVYFGAVRAAVISASSSSLSVTVPVGAIHAPITVTVNNLTAWANRPFQPTFAGNGANITGCTFNQPRVDLPAEAGPIFSAIGDIDGDGKPDLVVNNVYAHNFSVYRNVSTVGALTVNSFEAPVNYAVGQGSDNPYGLTLGDVDGDGKLDVVLCNYVGNQVSVYRNLSSSGSVSLDSPVSFNVGTDPRHVVVTDINGDGRPDLVTANYSGNNISVLRNVGSPGSLTVNSFARQDIPMGTATGPHDLVVGNFNEDGYPDIAVRASDYVSVFLNNTSGGFGSAVNYSAANYGIGITVGDINGDGHSDLITSTYSSQNLAVFAGSSGTFASVLSIGSGCWGHTTAVGDVNGDGKVDIGFVGEGPDRVAFYQNQSTASSIALGGQVSFGAGYNPWGISIGDLDGDGKPDALVCNAYDQTVSIYHNTTGQPCTPTQVSLELTGDDPIWENGGYTSFKVSRTGSTDSPLTVHFRLGGGPNDDPFYTAYCFDDFNVFFDAEQEEENLFRVEIPASSSEVELWISCVDDYTMEFWEEMVPIELEVDSAYVINPNASSLNVRIYDDDNY